MLFWLLVLAVPTTIVVGELMVEEERADGVKRQKKAKRKAREAAEAASERVRSHHAAREQELDERLKGL